MLYTAVAGQHRAPLTQQDSAGGTGARGRSRTPSESSDVGRYRSNRHPSPPTPSEDSHDEVPVSISMMRTSCIDPALLCSDSMHVEKISAYLNLLTSYIL